MKDRQVDQSGQQARIPVVSATLHCIAMTSIVFLRSSFGYLYLRPKSVFIAFAWAAILFSIYAWHEPRVWETYSFVCIFALGAVALYFMHLLFAVSSQIARKAAHDQYSGTSHVVRVMRLVGLSPSPVIESVIHLWAEPAIVLGAALLLRLQFGERQLSNWLGFVSACFWLKEAINHWFNLRQKKRQEDIFDDAGETADPHESREGSQVRPIPTRKPRVKRPRELG